MKILMLTPYLPFPPSSGGQIRSYNLIKYLSKNHDITLFCLIKDESERKYIKELNKYCKRVEVFKRSKNPWTIRNILRTGFGTYPFLVIRNLVPTEKRAIEKELEKNEYDLIHAETFYVMPHIPKTKAPILLVDQTIEYLVYKHYVSNQAPAISRPLFKIDVAKLKFWEKTYWEKANKVVAVSESDKSEMLKLSPGLDVGIVPNGVNLDFFKVKKSWEVKEPRILFVANFQWLQNIEAANLLIEKIYPLITNKLPKAKLWIVGQHIPDHIANKKSENILVDNLQEQDEEAIKKAYFEASIFLSPLKGPGGTRLKHFAAMASQLPLVTTTVGAEGLGAKNNTEIVVYDNPEKLAKAVIELLNDPQKAKKIALSARKLVEKHYSWQIMAQKLDKIYKEVANEKN